MCRDLLKQIVEYEAMNRGVAEAERTECCSCQRWKGRSMYIYICAQCGLSCLGCTINQAMIARQRRNLVPEQEQRSIEACPDLFAIRVSGNLIGPYVGIWGTGHSGVRRPASVIAVV